MLLNLYFSGIPRGVVKGVVSNPLFQIFLDPALSLGARLSRSKNSVLRFVLGVAVGPGTVV